MRPEVKTVALGYEGNRVASLVIRREDSKTTFKLNLMEMAGTTDAGVPAQSMMLDTYQTRKLYEFLKQNMEVPNVQAVG